MNTGHTTSTSQPIKLPTSLPLNAKEKRDFNYIVNYDLSLIRERIVKDNALDASIIDEAILEYRKFMVLVRLKRTLGHSGALPMCSREVDEVWHTQLLFTRDYATFCDGAFGRFVHHEPTTSRSSIDDAYSSSQAFLNAYVKVFGAPSGLWRFDCQLSAIGPFLDALSKDEAMGEIFRTAFPKFAKSLKIG